MPTCTCVRRREGGIVKCPHVLVWEGGRDGGRVKCPHVCAWEGRLNAHMYVIGRGG